MHISLSLSLSPPVYVLLLAINKWRGKVIIRRPQIKSYNQHYFNDKFSVMWLYVFYLLEFDSFQRQQNEIKKQSRRETCSTMSYRSQFRGLSTRM